MILADGAITPEDLPASVTRRAVAGSVRLAALPDPDELPNPATPDPVTGEVKTLREIERDVILATLDKNEGGQAVHGQGARHRPEDPVQQAQQLRGETRRGGSPWGRASGLSPSGAAASEIKPRSAVTFR